MNSKIASILFDEGIYKIEEPGEGQNLYDSNIHGNPKASTLCLFIKNDFSHPKDEEMVLAENIMKAIGLDENSYAWSYSREILDEEWPQKHIFIFGAQDHTEIDKYPINKWLIEQDSLILRTHSLSELISDIEKKKMLWTNLKEFAKWSEKLKDEQ